MKRIASFVPRNFQTLKTHVMPASSSLRISKQKPVKRTIIRKHKHKKHTRKNMLFNKVVSYLISDPYMYNPMVSPQPTFDFPPPKQIPTFQGGGQGDVALPLRGSNKKLIEKVVDFLEADCYLYSPLLTNDHLYSRSRPATPRPGHSQSLWGRESTETEAGQMEHRERGGGEIHARARTVVTGAYRESLEHMVRQNYRTKSTQGASELRKSSVE